MVKRARLLRASPLIYKCCAAVSILQEKKVYTRSTAQTRAANLRVFPKSSTELPIERHGCSMQSPKLLKDDLSFSSVRNSAMLMNFYVRLTDTAYVHSNVLVLRADYVM